MIQTSIPNVLLRACLLGFAIVGWGLVGCGDRTPSQPAAEKPAPANPAPTATTPTPPAKTPSTAVQQATADQDIPPIVANPPKLDFGIVEPGSELNADVTLLNTSNRPLRIIRAQPSCTCTTVDMTNVTIPPRSTVQMPISMKTNLAVGKKIARVQLIVSGYTKFFTINIDAENAWAIRTIPPHISIKEKSDIEAKPVGRYSLQSLDRAPFRVLSVLGEDPQFEGFDPATDEPRNQYLLNYDFSKIPCEELPPYLIIRTDHPRAQLFDIRVRHEPCTRITAALPMGDYRSSLGIVKPGQAVEVPLTFKKLRSPKITSVRSTDPMIETTLIDQTVDGKETMTITIAKIASTATEGLFQIPIIYSDGEKSAEHLYYGWVEQ